MSEMDSPGKDGLLEEAATWFARMRGPDAEESRAEFEKWLARGALHRRAYNRAAEVFAMGKLLAEDEHQNAAPAGRAKWREPRLLGGVMAAVLVMATTGWFLLHGSSLERNDPKGWPVIGLSATGPVAELATSNEPQSIRLADNSLVRLASGTSLAVQFGHAERRLLLERGIARFYVAHEPRPFIVSAGGGYVVAHGTVFEVALARDRRVTVGLIEGAVDVTAPMPANNPRRQRQQRRLRPGEKMSFVVAEEPASAVSPAEASFGPAGAWGQSTTGAVDFSSITLAELIRLANQGTSRPIRIRDEGTGRLRMSGTFRIDDTEVLAQRIAVLFNLAIDRSNPAEIVLSPK